MVNYEFDYIWGEEQQVKIYKYLMNKWGEDLIPQSRFSKYDFVSPEINMEVKSRKCSVNKYPTTLLTGNKIDDLSKKNIFVFNFVYDMVNDLSEIFYIEYDEEKFNNYKKQNFSRANKKWDEKLYYYIPIQDLTFLYREVLTETKPKKLFKDKETPKTKKQKPHPMLLSCIV